MDRSTMIHILKDAMECEGWNIGDIEEMVEEAEELTRAEDEAYGC